MVLTLDVSRDGARPRVGVIGAGRWGWNLVRTLHALEVLHAVADPRDEVRDRVSVEYPDVLVLATHQDLLSSGVDAVVIATPASTHAVLAIEALRAGKATFVEKPFALTVEDAERIVHEADAEQLVLMAGHLLLYQPAIVWLSDFLRSGRIGWVASFYQDRLSLGTVRRLENSLWSLGVHDVAAILYLAGQEPVRLAAWGQAILQPGIEDDMHLHMRFPDGAEAHIHNSWLWPEQRRRLTIVGTEAMVVLDESDQTVELHRRRANADLTVLDEGHEVLFQGDRDPLRRELEHFIDCLARGATPRSDGRSALNVVRVLASADEQMRRGDQAPLSEGSV